MTHPFTVYVLYSAKFNKIYIGYTSHLINRMKSHNFLASKGYTKRFRPWKVAYTEIFYNKSDALKREKELKSARVRQFIWNYISDHKKYW